MATLLFETRRQFAVVRYVASHQQLLFRSNKGEGGPTRAEILFSAVQFMCMKTIVYEDFNIYEISPEETLHYLDLGHLYGDLPKSCRVFGIGGPSVGGVLVASGYVHVEDDAEFWEPSSILQFDS